MNFFIFLDISSKFGTHLKRNDEYIDECGREFASIACVIEIECLTIHCEKMPYVAPNVSRGGPKNVFQ